jgi:hypothetical protein
VRNRRVGCSAANSEHFGSSDVDDMSSIAFDHIRREDLHAVNYAPQSRLDTQTGIVADQPRRTEFSSAASGQLTEGSEIQPVAVDRDGFNILRLDFLEGSGQRVLILIKASANPMSRAAPVITATLPVRCVLGRRANVSLTCAILSNFLASRSGA